MDQENWERTQLEISSKPFLYLVEASTKSAAQLRSGDLCPHCESEKLDYDGLLNLSCPRCGPAVGACFT